VGVLESSSRKKKMPTKQQFEDCKDTKKNQNNTENTSRACSLENKVGVLKSSSVKNKKQHKKNILKIAKVEETPKQHGECIKSLIF
jgi:hypothetical protein